MHGYTVVGYDVHRKKHIRALPLVGALQTGRYHLLEGVWNQAYIDEFVAFKPKGACMTTRWMPAAGRGR